MNYSQKLYETSKLLVLVNNILFGKLFLSLELPITFDGRFKVTLVRFFIPDCNLLSCELDNFMFKGLH